MTGILLIAIIFGLFLLVGVVAAVYFFLVDSDQKLGGTDQNKFISANLRAMVLAQRATESEEHPNRPQKLAVAAAAESGLVQAESHKAFRFDLKRRLYYSRLNLTVIQTRLIQLVVGLVPASFFATFGHLLFPGGSCYILALICLFMFPMLVSDFIDYKVNARFQAFDKDYASLIMSYVSLLKTGMSVLTGLEAAAEGLDEGSLVRAEVKLLIDRIKVGLSEEQAIGIFGEDINHPEIELFVQALILSRRLGGNLSNTLERLAKQIRKRSQFRDQANAAIGMERGSMKAVAVIMTALMIYLSYTNPEIFETAFKNSIGWQITQAGVAFILLGFYLSKKITKIKV